MASFRHKISYHSNVPWVIGKRRSDRLSAPNPENWWWLGVRPPPDKLCPWPFQLYVGEGVLLTLCGRDHVTKRDLSVYLPCAWVMKLWMMKDWPAWWQWSSSTDSGSWRLTNLWHRWTSYTFTVLANRYWLATETIVSQWPSFCRVTGPLRSLTFKPNDKLCPPRLSLSHSLTPRPPTCSSQADAEDEAFRAGTTAFRFRHTGHEIAGKNGFVATSSNVEPRNSIRTSYTCPL